MPIYLIAEVKYYQLFDGEREYVNLRSDLGYFDNYNDCKDYVNSHNETNYQKWVTDKKKSFARLMENHYYPELLTEEEKNSNYGININFLKDPDYSFERYIRMPNVIYYKIITIAEHTMIEEKNL